MVLLVSVPAWAAVRQMRSCLGHDRGPVRWGELGGEGYLAFGHDEPIVTDLVDRSAGAGPNKAGGLSGEETPTFTSTEGNLVIPVRFWGSAKQVPYMNEYIASGNISGTGAFSRATGNVTVHGQYIVDMGIFQNRPPNAWPWVWMAEIHGTICGRK